VKVERVIDLPELKLLTDAVEAARFIPQEKSEVLIGKPLTLTSKYEAAHLNRNSALTKESRQITVLVECF